MIRQRAGIPSPTRSTVLPSWLRIDLLTPPSMVRIAGSDGLSLPVFRNNASDSSRAVVEGANAQLAGECAGIPGASVMAPQEKQHLKCPDRRNRRLEKL